MHRHFSRGYHSLLWNMVWITSWRDGSHVCGVATFQMIWTLMMMTKMIILKVMMGSWNSISMEQNDLPIGAIVGSNDTINSSTLMERVLAQLVTTRQEITNECKEGDVTLYEYATSHMKILACNICNICLTKANAISHPRLLLRCIEDGLRNNVKRLKNWRETMFIHTNVRTKRCHE